jgi:hypothetical protein
MNNILGQFYSGGYNVSSSKNNLMTNKNQHYQYSSNGLGISNEKNSSGYKNNNSSLYQNSPYRNQNNSSTDINRQNLLESINKNMFYSSSSKNIVNSNFNYNSDNKLSLNNSPHKKLYTPIHERQDSSKKNNVIENLDLFKLDMTKDLLKILKGQKKIQNDEFMSELEDFNRLIRSTIEERNKNKNDQIKMLTNDLSKYYKEISKFIEEDSENNIYEYNKFQAQMKAYKEEMKNKLNGLENSQKLHLQELGYIMLNQGDEKSELFSHQYVNIRSVHQGKKSLKGVLESYKRVINYVTPADYEINDVVENLNFRRTEKNKKRGKFDSVLADQQLLEIYGAKNRGNLNLLLKDQNQKIDQDLYNLDIEEYKNLKLSDITEKTKLLRRDEMKRSFEKISYEETNFNEDINNVKLKGINKFRSYVNVIISRNRFNKLYSERISHIRLETLKHFKNHYNKVELEIQNWLMNSTKSTYYAMKNSEDLDVDLSNLGSTRGSVLFSSEMKEKFVKLEIRLKSFLEQILENLNKNTFDFDTLAFLKILITENHPLPIKFFSSFEISRLEFIDDNLQYEFSDVFHKNKILVNLSETQKLMIILFFVMIKIFLKNILLENKNFKHQKVRKNFKMIASVYYHIIIEYFKSKLEVKTDAESIVESELNSNQIKLSRLNYEELPFKKGVDREYVITANKYSYKKYKLAASIMKRETEASNHSLMQQFNMLNEINEILPDFNPDYDCNEFQCVSNHIYKKNELQPYFILAQQRNITESLKTLILEIGQRLLNLLMGKSVI